MDRTRQQTGKTGEFDMVLGWIDCIAIAIIVAFVLDLKR
jgi:hypothetical protein